MLFWISPPWFARITNNFVLFLPYFYVCSGLNHIVCKKNLNIAHAMMCFWNCWVGLKYKTSSKDALPQLKNKQFNFVNLLKNEIQFTFFVRSFCRERKKLIGSEWSCKQNHAPTFLRKNVLQKFDLEIMNILEHITKQFLSNNKV